MGSDALFCGLKKQDCCWCSVLLEVLARSYSLMLSGSIGGKRTELAIDGRSLRTALQFLRYHAAMSSSYLLPLEGGRGEKIS